MASCKVIAGGRPIVSSTNGKAEKLAADSGKARQGQGVWLLPSLPCASQAELAFGRGSRFAEQQRLCQYGHQHNLVIPASPQSTPHTSLYSTTTPTHPSQWPLNVSPTSSPTSPRASRRSSRCMHPKPLSTTFPRSPSP
jgi:hypothetical protein